MGTDAGAHLAEEIANPRINAPKVIVRFQTNARVAHAH